MKLPSRFAGTGAILFSSTVLTIYSAVASDLHIRDRAQWCSAQFSVANTKDQFWKILEPKILLNDSRGTYFQSLIAREYLWEKKVISVAFNGGNTALYKQISDVANEWTEYANVSFDFFVTDEKQDYRVWSESDTEKAADIRVGFVSEGEQSGNWSYIGVASDEYKVNVATMNLQGFIETLPGDWSALVLHEFGHALGFLHEHQAPSGECAESFRWEDDEGYKPGEPHEEHGYQPNDTGNPGIYTVMEGPPYNWSHTQVTWDLMRLEESYAFPATVFDSSSIMMYRYDDWMYKEGKDSPCYIERDNTVLSKKDITGARCAYPSFSTEALCIELVKLQFNSMVDDANLTSSQIDLLNNLLINNR